MALSEKRKKAILASWKTGEYTMRELSRKHKVSTDTVSRIVTDTKDNPGGLYIIQAGDTENYKIGISKKAKERMNTLQTGHYEELKFVRLYHVSCMTTIEIELHAIFKREEKHIRGEWFRLTKEDLENIDRIIMEEESNG